MRTGCANERSNFFSAWNCFFLFVGIILAIFPVVLDHLFLPPGLDWFGCSVERTSPHAYQLAIKCSASSRQKFVLLLTSKDVKLQQRIFTEFCESDLRKQLWFLLFFSIDTSEHSAGIVNFFAQRSEFGKFTRVSWHLKDTIRTLPSAARLELNFSSGSLMDLIGWVLVRNVNRWHSSLTSMSRITNRVCLLLSSAGRNHLKNRNDESGEPDLIFFPHSRCNFDLFGVNFVRRFHLFVRELERLLFRRLDPRSLLYNFWYCGDGLLLRNVELF